MRLMIDLKSVRSVALSACVVMAMATGAQAITGEPTTPTTPTEPKDPPTPTEPKNPGTQNPVLEEPDNPEIGKRSVKQKQKVKVKVPVKTSVPQTPVYPVKTHNNYCPNGLQPVTVDGSISCGSPNTSVTYRQMMSHPKPKVKTRRVYSARPSYVDTCTPGLKGCSDR